MEYIFDGHVKGLIEKLDLRAKEKGPCDLGQILMYYSHDSNGELSVGLKFGTQVRDERSAVPPLNDHIALAKLTGYVAGWKGWVDRWRAWVPWPYLQTLLESRARLAMEARQVTDMEFRRAGRGDVESVEKMEFEDDEDARVNLFTSLVRAHDPLTGDLVPRASVVSNAITFLVAGSHSTTATLEIFWWYLLHYPEVKQKMMAEIDEVFGKPTSDDDILPFAGMESQLPFTAAVWKEIYRLSPTFQHPSPRLTPLPGEPRYPTVIGGTEIPAGQGISVSVYSLHHNREVWGADVDVFRPTRWLEDEKTKGNEGLLMHFGQGHRACIGRNQSLIMLWKAAIEMLRRFDIVLADEKAVEDKDCRLRVTGFAELKDHLEVKVRRRTIAPQ